MNDDTLSPATRPWLGAFIAVTVIALLGGGMILGWSNEDRDVGILLAIVLVGLVSGLLVAKRPQHPISWLLTATALAGGIAGLSAEVLPPRVTELTWWQTVLAVVSGPAWYAVLFTVLVLIPLLFPTGAPPSPRWRWLGWILGAAVAALAVLWMLQEEFCTGWSPADVCISAVSNPIGIRGLPNPEESAFGTVLFGALLTGAIAALISLIIRFRRSGAVERQQIKWVAFSVGLFIFFTTLDVLWEDVMGRSEPPGYSLLEQSLWVMIPASIAVAILRYRLYEIDRIVSRTVSYALIAIVLAAVYAGGVIGIQGLLPESGDLAIAASTLVAAALFTPLRRRVQDWVDRRFNRRRYDAERVVEAFSTRLRDAVDLVGVTDDLKSVIARTVEPVTASVWVREGEPT